jgi:stage III sporulation protein AH
MKSKIIGKKQLLSFSLVVALGLSVYVNWYYTNNFNDATTPESTEYHNLGDAQLVNSNSVTNISDYFTQAKINREKSHDEAIDNLEDIISNNENDKETVTLAKNELMKISEMIKLEVDIENIIKAQLSEDCLVTYNDNSIEVIMPKGTVNESNIVKIKDIVLSKSDVSAEKIVVIELK